MKTIPVEFTIRNKHKIELPVSVSVERELTPPKRPTEQVAHTFIVFLRAVFDWNYQANNFHLNPKEDMYIRNEYPRNPDKSGIKPGIVFDEPGSTKRAVPYLGRAGYIPMPRRNMSTFRGGDEVYQGRIRLKTLSPTEEEAEYLAYLVDLTLKEYSDYVEGVHGITWIRTNGYSKGQPMNITSDYELWACTVDIDYVQTVLYTKTRIDGPEFDGFTYDVKIDGEDENKED